MSKVSFFSNDPDCDPMTLILKLDLHSQDIPSYQKWSSNVEWFKSYFYFFLKVFGGNIHMSFLGATGTPTLDFWWHLLWVSKPEWVLPYLLFAEANVMYIPRDPPLCYMCRPLGGWRAASPVPTYCCRGEVARIRTRALRISVSQTLSGSKVIACIDRNTDRQAWLKT